MKRTGTLAGIARKRERRAPMQEIASTMLTTTSGVDGDARGTRGRRQVTIIGRQSWEAACADLGAADLTWTTRRANLLIDGIELAGTTGYDLRIGSAVIRITGETRPCSRMDAERPGLRAALSPQWRGGATGSVLQSGAIAIGAEVVLSRSIVRQSSYVLYEFARRLLKRGRRAAGVLARRLGLKEEPLVEQHD